MIDTVHGHFRWENAWENRLVYLYLALSDNRHFNCFTAFPVLLLMVGLYGSSLTRLSVIRAIRTG